jgi:hypothetical protein
MSLNGIMSLVGNVLIVSFMMLTFSLTSYSQNREWGKKNESSENVDTLENCQNVINQYLMHPITKQKSAKRFVEQVADIIYANNQTELTYIQKKFLIGQAIYESASGTHFLSFFGNPFNFAIDCNKKDKLPFKYEGGDPMKCYRKFENLNDIINNYVLSTKYGNAFNAASTEEFIFEVCSPGYAEACRYTSTCVESAIEDRCGCKIVNGKKILTDINTWSKNTAKETIVSCFKESDYFKNIIGTNNKIKNVFDKAKDILISCDSIPGKIHTFRTNIIDSWDESHIGEAKEEELIDQEEYIHNAIFFDKIKSGVVQINNLEIFEKKLWRNNQFLGRYVWYKGLNKILPQKDLNAISIQMYSPLSDGIIKYIKPEWSNNLCNQISSKEIALENFKVLYCSRVQKESYPKFDNDEYIQSVKDKVSLCDGVKHESWMGQLASCVARVETKGNPHLISLKGSTCGGADGKIAYGSFQLQINNFKKIDPHFIGNIMNSSSFVDIEEGFFDKYNFEESELISNTICDEEGSSNVCIGLYTVLSKVEDFLRRSQNKPLDGLPSNSVTIGKEKIYLTQFKNCNKWIKDNYSLDKRNACLGLALGYIYNSSASEHKKYAEKIYQCMSNENTFVNFDQLKKMVN